jgi:hypothetical protein
MRYIDALYPEASMSERDDATLSRRGLLKKGAAAAAGGAVIAAHGLPSMAQGQAPAVVTARRFRGWVTRGGGAQRTTLQELTLRSISGRHPANASSTMR